MLAWGKSIIDRHFDKIFLLVWFVVSCVLLVKYPDNKELGAFITGGAVLGAVLMLITGNKKSPTSPDGPTAGKVVTDVHTEEENKPNG